MDPRSAEDPPRFVHIACPHCSATLQATSQPHAQILTCPDCCRDFILPGQDGSAPPVASFPAPTEFVINDEPSEPAVPEETDDLDGLRIRRIAQEKRAAFRTTMYCRLGALIAATIAAQLIWNAVRHVRHSAWGLMPTLYSLAALAGVLVAVWLWQRPSRLLRQDQGFPVVYPPDDHPPRIKKSRPRYAGGQLSSGKNTVFSETTPRSHHG